MNSIKPFYISAIAMLALAGCGASKQIATTTAPSVTAPVIIKKVAPIADIDLKRWSHLDLAKDTIPGMSVDKAYAELLKDKKGIKVIVGIVDSGVDIEHEDLKSVVWTNAKEIPANGIDDDKNGYIDDIHGWNFLGDAVNENLEMTRIIKKADDGSATYKEAKKVYDERYSKALEDKKQVDFIVNTNQSIQNYLKKDVYTVEDLNAIVTTDNDLNKNKMIMTQILSRSGAGIFDEIKEYREYVYDNFDFKLNKEFEGRKIVGDNPEDIKDRKYGNNIVFGPDKEKALHGTHVAGIIAQVRNNNLGGDGVANHVEIMAVRAVPNGDEYDKDIALAIRYAVDNGAKVINGSFGKNFSPNKEWVFDAIKYAGKKDVLLVFGSGNDGNNIDLDVNSNFPRDSKDNKTEFASNVLSIGALTDVYGESVIAPYSNYGKLNVDVFAPGSEIYASVPNNKYKYLQGTSMASPNAAGVAALIRSYYPKLSAKEVKQILMDSGTPLPATVALGESQEKKSVAETSKSGKMINAYDALLMAERMSKK